MDHVWTVFCSRSLVDADTKQLSLIDTIEKVTVTALPGKQIPANSAVELSCSLVSLWTRSDFDVPESGLCRVRLFGPDGQEIEPAEPMLYDADLTDKRRLRTQVRLQGLPLGIPGRYVFQTETFVEPGWVEVARTPYELEIQLGGEAAPDLIAPPKAAKSRRKPRK